MPQICIGQIILRCPSLEDENCGLQVPGSMETEETEVEAEVGSMEVSPAVLPELEVYITLLVLMMEVDSQQFSEVGRDSSYPGQCNTLCMIYPAEPLASQHMAGSRSFHTCS